MHIDWPWIISGWIAAVVVVKMWVMSRRIASLEREIRFLQEKLGTAPSQTTSWPSPVASSTGSPFPTGSMPEVEHYIRQNQKINAIKVYREQTGVGLKDAKDAVEAMERRMKYGV